MPRPSIAFPVLALILLLMAALPSAARAAEAMRVVAVTDGDTLLLDDGRAVRLAGIEAAKPPMGAYPAAAGEPERHWPLAEAATAALADLALGHTVTIRGEAATDRYGRLSVHLLRDDGLWLQGALLERGMARVHTLPDSRAFAAAMLALEERARLAGRGIWRSRIYAVRPADPDTLRRDRDSFQIVEGRVRRVTKSTKEVYLDFGDDWRSDVTVHIPHAALAGFAAAGIDPLSYEGRRVRVRGWVGLRAGPLIEATHPEQIERLDESPRP